MLLWAAFSDQWTLNHKVTFDGINRKIYVADSVSSLNVKADIYSSWKEWVQLYDNAKFLPAIRTIGGDALGNGQFAGDLYFLLNGWQIIIDHAIAVEGVLYHDDPISPFIIEAGGGVVSTVSNLATSVATASAGLTIEERALLDKILQYAKFGASVSA